MIARLARRLLLLAGVWALIGAPAPPVSAAAAKVRWFLGPRDMKALRLNPGQISAVTLSDDGRRLFVLQPLAPHDIQLLVLDVATRRAVRNLLLDAAEVDALAVSADGARVFVLCDAATKAFWMDVASGKASPAWVKPSGAGFRFTPPYSVRFLPDGRVRCGGIFLNEGGQSTGGVVATLGPGTTLTRTVEQAPLQQKAHGVGVLPEVAVAPNDTTRVAFVSKPDAASARLYLVGEGGAVRLLDEGQRVQHLRIDNQGNRLLYYVLKGSDGRLVLDSLPAGKPIKTWKGYFAPASVSADGSRILVARVDSGKPLRQQLLFATQEGGWTLTPLEVPGWKAALEVYALAANGRTFMLWSDTAIVVGSLP